MVAKYARNVSSANIQRWQIRPKVMVFKAVAKRLVQIIAAMDQD